MKNSPEQDQRTSIIEELLLALVGIISVRTVFGSDGRLVEIHLLATGELGPKQIVRNVESALRAGLGLEIDRRIVSVAQLRSGLTIEDLTANQVSEMRPVEEPSVSAGADGTPAREAGEIDMRASATATAGSGPADESGTEEESEPERLIFLGHEVTLSADRRATCTVSFRGSSGQFVGRGSGLDTVQGRAEAAARAVIEVLDEYRAPERFGLEGVAIVELQDRRCVLVSARPLGQYRGLTLTGSALLGDSPEEASIMAVLQATNSWRAPT